MLWGHRRNVEGYHQELVQFDERLTQFIKNMNQDDLLLITADHGNDPTYKGSDHTRENVPLIAYSPSMQGKGHLVQRNCFGDVAATIAENFNVKSPYINGKSFFKQLR
jgi:phosphopentomutase